MRIVSEASKLYNEHSY